jgi:hypothetical protein
MYVRATREPQVDYVLQPTDGVVGLSNTEPTIITLDVTDELRNGTRDADGISAVDLVEDEREQIRRFGRVLFRKVQS